MSNRKTFGNRYADGGQAMQMRMGVKNQPSGGFTGQQQNKMAPAGGKNPAQRQPVGQPGSMPNNKMTNQNNRLQNRVDRLQDKVQNLRGQKRELMSGQVAAPAGGIIGDVLGDLTGGAGYGNTMGQQQNFIGQPRTMEMPIGGGYGNVDQQQINQPNPENMVRYPMYNQGMMGGYGDMSDYSGYEQYGMQPYGMQTMHQYQPQQQYQPPQPQYQQQPMQQPMQQQPYVPRYIGSNEATDKAYLQKFGTQPGDKNYVQKMVQYYKGQGFPVPNELRQHWQSEQKRVSGLLGTNQQKSGARNKMGTKSSAVKGQSAAGRAGGKRKAAGGPVAATKKSATAYRGGGLARKGMGATMAKGGVAKRNTSRGKGR